MCVIAGYTGSRRAAPILIEMLKKVEFFDGGLATGIATIHEGKLYSTKLVGDVETLLRETDAINFPGTTGIIHTRPAGGRASHAHPFVDESHEFAFCENGVYFQVAAPEYKKNVEGIIGDLYNKGVTFTSAIGNPGDTWDAYHPLLPSGQTIHNAESYTQAIGWAVKDTPTEALGAAIAENTAKYLSLMPSELVTLSIHARLPDTITIGRVTRPMTVASRGGESYICTTPIGFPEEVQNWPITFIPPTTIAQVTSRGYFQTGIEIEGVRVEQADARVFSIVRQRLEAALSAASEENPIAYYDLTKYYTVAELWHEPLIDCHISSGQAHLKEHAATTYRVLWSFYREGRLRMKAAPYKHLTMLHFWLEN